MLLDDVLEDSVVPTTPVTGVLVVVMMGGPAGSGLGVTVVCVSTPVVPMIGVDVVVVQTCVSPTRYVTRMTRSGADGSDTKPFASRARVRIRA
jgi:hypothetical protein